MTKFHIKELSGVTTTFDFDINHSLSEFRECISTKGGYTLGVEGKPRIYENDRADLSLRALFEQYDPELLNRNEITFYLLLNLGLPQLRTGKNSIPNGKEQETEDSNDVSRLVCPITTEIPTRAIKINGHFYDLHAFAEYLLHQYQTHLSAYEICDPFRQKLPEALAHAIATHDYDSSEANKSHMEWILLMKHDFRADQREHTKLLEDVYTQFTASSSSSSASSSSASSSSAAQQPEPLIISGRKRPHDEADSDSDVDDNIPSTKKPRKK